MNGHGKQTPRSGEYASDSFSLNEFENNLNDMEADFANVSEEEIVFVLYMNDHYVLFHHHTYENNSDNNNSDNNSNRNKKWHHSKKHTIALLDRNSLVNTLKCVNSKKSFNLGASIRHRNKDNKQHKDKDKNSEDSAEEYSKINLQMKVVLALF